MQSRYKNPITYLVLIISLGLGLRFAFETWRMQDGGKQSTQILFAANFPNTQGAQQALSQYKNKTIVLNFWATWCEPCREEMPELSALYNAHKNHNVVVLGIAIDDVAAINDFAKTTPVSYPLFAAENGGMDLATTLGNNKAVLPYTVIIKPDGSLAKIYFGRVNKALIEQTLLPLIHNS